MVVQNAEMDFNMFSINSKVFRCFTLKSKPEGGRKENELSKNTLLDDRFPA